MAVSLENIFVQQDPVNGSFTLKLGNFIAARSEPLADDSIETEPTEPVVNDENTFNTEIDTRASAHILFSILSYQEHSTITGDDVEVIPQIEFRILILALLDGISASDALNSPAFSTVAERLETLNKIHQIAKDDYARNTEKARNGEPMNEELLNEMEENAGLVIGNQGTWLPKLSNSLISTYGMHGPNGYIISFVTELLRLIRNVFAHIREDLDLVEEVFGSRNPTNEQIFEYFSERFSFFYLHILKVYLKVASPEKLDDKYFQIYMKYETTACEDGKNSGNILPLHKTNQVSAHFHTLPELKIITLEIKPQAPAKPYSIISGKIILPVIELEAKHI